MRCRRFRRLMLVPLGIVLLPVVAWIAVVLAAPTEWARAHLATALEHASGRSVGLESLSICLGGGVELANLKIGAPGGLSDPWLQAARVRLDLSLSQLLFGTFNATDLEVENVKLRVLRREDGSLELADLVRSPRPPRAAEDPSSRGLQSLPFRLRNAEVELVDRPTRSRITLTQVNGDGLWDAGKTVSANLNGLVNNGTFQITGALDRSPSRPSFEGQFRAEGVQLNDGLAVLRYFVPVLAGTSPKVGGVLKMDMYLRGEGNSRDRLRETLVGRGQIAIDPIDLDGTELLREVERAINLPRKNRLASLHSDFAVKEGRITTNRLALNMAKAPIVISGWTDFDGRLDYRMGLNRITDRIPARARQVLANLDLDLDGLSSLQLSGTVDDLTVSVRSLDPNAGSALDNLLNNPDEQRLKRIGQEFRDRLFR